MNILEYIEHTVAQAKGQPVMVDLNQIASLKIAGRGHLPPTEQLVEWARDKGWDAELNLPSYVVTIRDRLARELQTCTPLTLSEAATLLNQFPNRRRALQAANQISNKSNLDLVTVLNALTEMLKLNPTLLDNCESWLFADIPELPSHGGKFHREQFGIPHQASPTEKQLRQWAEEYHQRTEEYDRSVCTGPIQNGAVMPNGPLERALITTNARRLNDHYCSLANSLGFSNKQWADARHAAAPRRS